MQSLKFFSEKVVKVSFKLIFNLSKYLFGTYLLIEGSWKRCNVCEGCDSFETCVLHLCKNKSGRITKTVDIK